MFAKHLAKIDEKTFSFSIWDIGKMLPTTVFVGGKTKINRMYNKCEFRPTDFMKMKEQLETNVVEKQKTSLPATPPFKGRRKYKEAKKILSTKRLVEFLSEH